jgi:hypothetical protein
MIRSTLTLYDLERNFHRSVFELHLIWIGNVNDITCYESLQRTTETPSNVSMFWKRNHFRTIQVYICRVVIRFVVTDISGINIPVVTIRFYTQTRASSMAGCMCTTGHGTYWNRCGWDFIKSIRSKGFKYNLQTMLDCFISQILLEVVIIILGITFR